MLRLEVLISPETSQTPESCTPLRRQSDLGGQGAVNHVYFWSVNLTRAA